MTKYTSNEDVIKYLDSREPTVRIHFRLARSGRRATTAGHLRLVGAGEQQP